MHITPTVGRVVWFHPFPGDTTHANYGVQPLSATVSYVWSDRMAATAQSTAVDPGAAA